MSASTPSSLTVFLDTNCLYDFNALEKIKWLDHLGVDTVRLVLAPVVIRELNEHKDGGRHPRLTERAQSIIGSLSELLKGK